jgi:hypothetical protein
MIAMLQSRTHNCGVLRLANAEASGSFGHKMTITKEDLLNLNARLNAIEKKHQD